MPHLGLGSQLHFLFHVPKARKQHHKRASRQKRKVSGKEIPSPAHCFFIYYAYGFPHGIIVNSYCQLTLVLCILMAELNELAAQVTRLTMAMDQLMSQNQQSGNGSPPINVDQDSSEESEGWNDLVQCSRNPSVSAFVVSKLSTSPSPNIVKTLMDETVPFTGVPKTPSYTKGDDRRLIQLQKKIECSLHTLSTLVEDNSNQQQLTKNTQQLAALLRSSFEDVNNMRRASVARGHFSCLDPRPGETPLLTNEESKKLANAKSRSSKQFNPRRGQNRGFRRNNSSSFRRYSNKKFSYKKSSQSKFKKTQSTND